MFILPFFINLSACEYLSPDALVFYAATSKAKFECVQSFLNGRQATLDLSEMRIDEEKLVKCLGERSLLPLFRKIVITDKQAALIQAQSAVFAQLQLKGVKVLLKTTVPNNPFSLPNYDRFLVFNLNSVWSQWQWDIQCRKWRAIKISFQPLDLAGLSSFSVSTVTAVFPQVSVLNPQGF